MPPMKVQLQFAVQTYGVVSLAKTVQRINHPANKGTARPNNLSCVMEVTSERLQLTPVSPTEGGPERNQSL